MHPEIAHLCTRQSFGTGQRDVVRCEGPVTDLFFPLARIHLKGVFNRVFTGGIVGEFDVFRHPEGGDNLEGFFKGIAQVGSPFSGAAAIGKKADAIAQHGVGQTPGLQLFKFSASCNCLKFRADALAVPQDDLQLISPADSRAKGV